MRGSGDGWTTCALGHRHWGRYGAAGLLLRAGPEADAALVLQLRVGWSHHGGTWGIPGGARDEHESAVAGALRESAEEAGIDPEDVAVEATFRDDHGGWAYTTVTATAVGDPHPRPVGPESDDVVWATLDRLDRISLHPGFTASWPELRRLGPAPVIVVDAANVIGSRPDGWWRDRAGAVARLRDQLADGFRAGLPDPVLAGWRRVAPAVATGPTEPMGADLAVRWFPRLVLVTEGQARSVPGTAAVEVATASGSGDDRVVDVAAGYRHGRRPVIVVSADRELRSRVEAEGATVIGPRTLLDLL